MSGLLKSLEKRLDERMGPVAAKLDLVLEESKKQTKILEEIRDALKKRV